MQTFDHQNVVGLNHNSVLMPRVFDGNFIAMTIFVW